MAYNEYLAERKEQSLLQHGAYFETKKMFGGICFMVYDKMCIGIVKDELMARVGPENESQWLSKKGSRPMDFTGKRMKGYYFISPEGVDSDIDLDAWVKACLRFNPIAQSSKRKSR